MPEGTVVATEGTIIELDTDGTAPVAGVVSVWVKLRRIGKPGEVL